MFENPLFRKHDLKTNHYAKTNTILASFGIKNEIVNGEKK